MGSTREYRNAAEGAPKSAWKSQMELNTEGDFGFALRLEE